MNFMSSNQFSSSIALYVIYAGYIFLVAVILLLFFRIDCLLQKFSTHSHLKLGNFNKIKVTMCKIHRKLIIQK